MYVEYEFILQDFPLRHSWWCSHPSCLLYIKYISNYKHVALLSSKMLGCIHRVDKALNLHPDSSFFTQEIKAAPLFSRLAQVSTTELLTFFDSVRADVHEHFQVLQPHIFQLLSVF